MIIFVFSVSLGLITLIQIGIDTEQNILEQQESQFKWLATVSGFSEEDRVSDDCYFREEIRLYDFKPNPNADIVWEPVNSMPFSTIKHGLGNCDQWIGEWEVAQPNSTNIMEKSP